MKCFINANPVSVDTNDVSNNNDQIINDTANILEARMRGRCQIASSNKFVLNTNRCSG